MTFREKDHVIGLIRLISHDIDFERLQRVTFLLSRCFLLARRDADIGWTFVYRRGGPHSYELETDWDNIQTEPKKASGDDGWFTKTFGMSVTDARSRLKMMEDVSDIVLEIAAALVYLKHERAYDNNQVIAELKVRKPLVSAREFYMNKARKLLQQLELY